MATAVVAGVTALCMARRPEELKVVGRPSPKVRTRPFAVLGEPAGPTHFVVGPGLFAFTHDPTGSFRRVAPPPGLVLERVRVPFASDGVNNPTSNYCVVQCRDTDTDTEVLYYLAPRHAKWLVGALTPQPWPYSFSFSSRSSRRDFRNSGLSSGATHVRRPGRGRPAPPGTRFLPAKSHTIGPTIEKSRMIRTQTTFGRCLTSSSGVFRQSMKV